MARLLGLLYLAGALLAAVSMFLPQPAAEDQPLVYLVIAIGALVGLALTLRRAALPSWALPAALGASTALVSLGIYATAQGTSVYALFYVWIALDAAYFLPPRAAAGQIALTGAIYAVVLAAMTPPDAVERWLITIGTVAVTGVFVGLLRSRVERLVSRLSEAVADLGEAARTDPLTGLFNRRGFHEHFTTELERSRRDGVPLALLVGDLDRFKRLNDRFGHGFGDRALLTLARVLREQSRRIDVVARIGGEEFALLVPGADGHEAYLFAERTRCAVQEAFAHESLLLTISFGIAVLPHVVGAPDAALGAADEALYAAKHLGRNRSVIYHPGLRSVSETTTNETRPGMQIATVVTLAEALDLRDGGTARHSHIVGRCAELTARRLGLSEERVERVRLAGMVHDVGKIAVSDAILQKPGPLDDAEWLEMRKHPETGARLLAGVGLEDVCAWVLAHHERPDGRGYPRASRGEEIPVEARILAIADAYEAMTSDRPYRRAIGPERARAELLCGAGTAVRLRGRRGAARRPRAAPRARALTRPPAQGLRRSRSSETELMQ